MFPAERHPNLREVHRFRHGFKGENGGAVVGNVARELLDWVFNGEDGENGVGGDERWLLVGVGGGDEDVDAGEVGAGVGVGRGGLIEFVVEGGEVGGAVDGVELGELIEKPGEGEPGLAYGGHRPQPHGVSVGVSDSPCDEQDQSYESDHH